MCTSYWKHACFFVWPCLGTCCLLKQSSLHTRCLNFLNFFPVIYIFAKILMRNDLICPKFIFESPVHLQCSLCIFMCTCMNDIKEKNTNYKCFSLTTKHPPPTHTHTYKDFGQTSIKFDFLKKFEPENSLLNCNFL